MGSLGIPDALLLRARRMADGIAAQIRQLGGRAVRIDADEILTGRAALLGLSAPGRVAAGGATRLLVGTDGWWALTLSRADDVDAVPALLELPDVGPDPWGPLSLAPAARAAADLVARARLLGMPAALLGECPPADPTVVAHNDTASATMKDLLVVDLSSMWAGPLCGRLLAAAGATVVKVESPERPDGTRAGHRGFFDWMNSEKLSYALDFDSPELAELLTAADVVIEGSRPAGLARRGLGAHQLPARPGRVWLRITGYPSATTPPWPADSSGRGRCSAATRSPIRSADWKPPGPSWIPWPPAAAPSSMCRWRPWPQRMRRCPRPVTPVHPHGCPPCRLEPPANSAPTTRRFAG